jgi:hypothetical protein
MSWDVIKSETTECACGKGTATFVVEMDDWNRVRNHTDIHCPDCLRKAAKDAEERQQKQAANEALYNEARMLATDRYQQKWLDLYSGLTKKAAWERYTGGAGYPALGTFYKHVKHAGGVSDYMRWSFESDFEDALRKMSIEDKDINNLLSQRSVEPVGPLRHPFG